MDVNTYGISVQIQCCFRSSPGAGKRVKYPIMFFGEQLDKPLRQSFGKDGAVLFIVTFRRKMQHIGRVGHITALPVGNILSETAADLGFITSPISIAEILETGFGPVAHRHHDFFLVHVKLS